MKLLSASGCWSGRRTPRSLTSRSSGRLYRYEGQGRLDASACTDPPGWSKRTPRVARCALKLRQVRNELIIRDSLSYREMYRALELPGEHPLKKVTEDLDSAVRSVYGLRKNSDPLSFLVSLNEKVHSRESGMQDVTGPGVPGCVRKRSELISTDCVGA